MAPRLGYKGLLHALVCSLLSALSICLVDDINCLKSIKGSLDDPLDHLKNWNFNNNTEGFICRFDGVECWHSEENKVLNIRLGNMGLKGQFPEGIKKCQSLTLLDLSNNELSGPIPSNISHIFRYGTSLDLSSNKFSGNIPESIANCSYLNKLRLDHNQLTGLIPPELALLNRLSNFSVANNQLHGSVPDFGDVGNTLNDERSYAGNTWLCGFPLEPCNDFKADFTFFFKRGFIIGFTLSLVSAITIFMSYCAPWVNRDQRNKLLRQFISTLILNRRIKNRENSHQTGKLLHLQDLLHENSKETSMLANLVTRMSYSDLSEATNDFSADNIIGVGQMGTTYKATLPTGWLLAIKRLFDTQTFDEHFTTELTTLGRLRHDNLVPLLGFCIESKEKFLVYKYMSNGNLYDWLHPADQGKAKFIDWPLRLKIAHGVSRGLVWLHHNCNLGVVVHLDICSKCILLDQSFEPKISNFGEAMLMKSNQTDWTSSFYVDSEFWELSFVKEDVYRFGILLLELITGYDPTKLAESSNYGDDQSLTKWVFDISERADFYDIVDKSLVGRGFDLEIFQIFRVACDCVQPNSDTRPTMLQVLKVIRTVGKRHDIKTSSELTKSSVSESSEAEITEHVGTMI
ncbi:hypothetical protein CCACVL1_30091 [Corchorus capsularis]|uniref:Protein kinase domain-containing protein n=1 Tax=Corchorus capsularis TaxID=210143 RepID=A0A1R3FYP4_COCAP|nr:hypothetical protein CCACVL1_30091 [Corchorus capsularis]